MTDEKTPPDREFLPGMMANLLSYAIHQHSKELDRATEQLLVAHFGSLEQAVARVGEYDLVFEDITVGLLDEGTDDTVFRFEQTVRLEMKEKP